MSENSIAVAFVDYDNAIVGPERTRIDAEVLLDEILESLSSRVRSLIQSADELLVRLYGGWTDKTGRATTRADWLTSLIPELRGRRNGLRVKPELITELAGDSNYRLRGTHRPDVDNKQKMVDAMLSFDVNFFAENYRYPLAVLTDDDDAVPALILGAVSRQQGKSGIWLLRRKKDDAPNDAYLGQRGVVIGSC